MSYQRRKKYTSRREKYERTKRNTKLVLIFATIALVVLIFKHRFDIITWINTYF